MSKFTLLAVFAHPDDEAFGTGGTLTKYAAAGVDVHLVMATRGEAGEIAEPDMATPANLPDVRERELRCACQHYGIHPPRFLGYTDGQLTVVHQGQAVGKLVRIIRELQPDVLISFGPDGIYGHYDHIAVHHWSVAAVELAADPECFPDKDACRPHQVSKLYFRAMPEEVIRARLESGQRPAVMMSGAPFYFTGRPMRDITTVIDVRDYVEVKRQGILCHQTQVGRNSRYANAEEMLNDPWFSQEHFVLARSAVGWPEGAETDLFARLRKPGT